MGEVVERKECLRHARCQNTGIIPMASSGEAAIERGSPQPSTSLRGVMAPLTKAAVVPSFSSGAVGRE